jgi:GT2 family glycosyltransferase
MYYEDMDLCLRVRTAGGQVLLLQDINLRHDHGGASRINVTTRALTKSEVMVSRHVYISRNIRGWSGVAMNASLVITNLFTLPLLSAIIGLICFFIPSMNVRARLYGHMLRYYAGAWWNRTWLSHRSVAFPERLTRR